MHQKKTALWCHISFHPSMPSTKAGLSLKEQNEIIPVKCHTVYIHILIYSSSVTRKILLFPLYRWKLRLREIKSVPKVRQFICLEDRMHISGIYLCLHPWWSNPIQSLGLNTICMLTTPKYLSIFYIYVSISILSIYQVWTSPWPPEFLCLSAYEPSSA